MPRRPSVLVERHLVLLGVGVEHEVGGADRLHHVDLDRVAVHGGLREAEGPRDTMFVLFSRCLYSRCWLLVYCGSGRRHVVANQVIHLAVRVKQVAANFNSVFTHLTPRRPSRCIYVCLWLLCCAVLCSVV